MGRAWDEARDCFPSPAAGKSPGRVSGGRAKHQETLRAPGQDGAAAAPGLPRHSDMAFLLLFLFFFIFISISIFSLIFIFIVLVLFNFLILVLFLF